MCNAYLKRGGRILGPEDHWRKGNTKLSAEAISWATSATVITEHRSLTLEQRCVKINEKFAVSIGRTTLKNYYKAAAISYRYPVRSLDTAWSEEQLRSRRVNFLYQLHHHVKNGTTVWWADEMSTNVWERLSRVWQLPGKFRVKQSTVWPRNVTVMGAICDQPPRLFYKLQEGTSTETVLAFFRDLNAEHRLEGEVVVLDNHPAHHSRAVKELFQELRCILLFLPPSSSTLNPIETVWSHVKRLWRRKLLLSEPELMTERWVYRELRAIAANFDSELLGKLARSHLGEIVKVLQETVAHYHSVPDLQLPVAPTLFHMDLGDEESADRIS